MSGVTKLFLSGYPLEMDEMGLVQLVSPYGGVSTVKIVRDKATRKAKGYVFLEMAGREAAQQVISALDGAEFQGKFLTVRIRDQEPVAPAPVYRKVEKFNSPVKKKRPRRQA
jgi:RNA recognition motif-containing protein